MTNSAIYGKLSKILALTKSPVEGEAQAATAMLTKLLTKHNLEISDLEATGVAAAPLVERQGVEINRNAAYAWKFDLAEVIAEHFFCYPLVSRRSKTIAFVGRPENVESLRMLYRWLSDQMVRLSREAREAHALQTGEKIHAVRWQMSFCEGATSRLGARLREDRKRMQEDVKAAALVVHHLGEISDWMEAQGSWSRPDGAKTKKQREWEEQEAARKAAETPEQRAAREEAERRADEAWAKRWERRQKRHRETYQGPTQEQLETARQKYVAEQAGRKAAGNISIHPFLDGGDAAAETVGALK